MAALCGQATGDAVDPVAGSVGAAGRDRSLQVCGAGGHVVVVGGRRLSDAAGRSLRGRPDCVSAGACLLHRRIRAGLVGQGQSRWVDLDRGSGAGESCGSAAAHRCGIESTGDRLRRGIGHDGRCRAGACMDASALGCDAAQRTFCSGGRGVLRRQRQSVGVGSLRRQYPDARASGAGHVLHRAVVHREVGAAELTHTDCRTAGGDHQQPSSFR